MLVFLALFVKWSLVALLALSTVTHIASIGKPRPPITPNMAIIQLLMMTYFIVGIVYFWR